MRKKHSKSGGGGNRRKKEKKVRWGDSRLFLHLGGTTKPFHKMKGMNFFLLIMVQYPSLLAKLVVSRTAAGGIFIIFIGQTDIMFALLVAFLNYTGPETGNLLFCACSTSSHITPQVLVRVCDLLYLRLHAFSSIYCLMLVLYSQQ